MLVSMGGSLSARSTKSDSSAKKRYGAKGWAQSERSNSCAGLPSISTAWQADVLLRLQRLEQKLDALDANTQLLVRASSSPANATRSMPSVHFAEDHLESPEQFLPDGRGHGGGAVLVVSSSAARTAAAGGARAWAQRHLLAGAEHPELRLPMPIGDKLVLEAPTWELFQAVEEEAADVPIVCGQQRGTTKGVEDDAKETCASPSRSADRSPRMGQGRSAVGSVAEVKARNAKRSKVLEALWNALDDPESGRVAAAYAGVMPYVIMFSVIAAILQTPSPPTIEGPVVILFDVLVEIVYALEFLLRALSCPAKRMFFYNYNNIIDLLVTVPLIFRGVVGLALVESEECGIICTVLMCFVPVIRALKALRRFETLQLLINASQKASEGLPVCLFALFVLTLLFASLIYIVEPRTNIESLPHAMWLTIVTMTTVGYGDVTPETLAGSMIVSVLVVFSVLYMAMPLGIVGNAFTEVWQDRDFILLRHRTSVKLRQWGYGAHDVPMLFELFDEDQDGELNLAEFVTMMDEIRIGLVPKRVVQLFEALDADGGGTIDDREFIRSVFPEEFDAMYPDVIGVDSTALDEEE